MAVRFSCFVFFFFFCVVLGVCAVRPHILMIVADDLGWNDVSFHGSKQIPTPNLDALAAQGVVLNNYYVQPVCSPTRSSILSGRHVIHTGVYNPFIDGELVALNTTCNLPGDQPCILLPQALKALGYATHIVGKWHLGYYDWDFIPTARGFDTHLGYYNGMEDYFNHTRSGGYDMHNNTETAWEFNGQYSTDIFASRAVQIIENHPPEVPLFLYLPFQSMHAPIEAPPICTDPFKHSITNPTRRIVAGIVSCMDLAVGTVIDALKRTNMFDQTTIVFTSDNGGPIDMEGNMASNMPLLGRKASYFEGGLRGAAFISGAGLSTTAYVSNQMIHACDWYFSLQTLAAMGINGSEQHSLVTKEFYKYMSQQPAFELGDGMDLWSTLSGNASSPRTEIIHVAHNTSYSQGVLRVGSYKLIIGRYDDGNTWYLTPGQSFTENNFTVQCGPPPQVCTCDPRAEPCLFNIELDPCEHVNLYSQNPDIAKAMIDRLHDYQRSATVDLSSGPEVPPQCLPSANNGTWMPCFGTPPYSPLYQ